MIVNDREPQSISVCVDCIVVLANGAETPQEVATAEAMANRWEGYAVVGACPENCEGSFSSRWCDGCGSTLAGDRHPAVAFPVEEK